MSIRAAFVVLLAIVCGVSAAMGVYQLRMDGSAQAVSEPETMPVVVAALSVSRGQMITANDVKIHEWPKQMVPEGALMKLEDAVDRAVAIPLFVDEPVVSAKLAPKDAGRGLAALVPNGMRAYTIQTVAGGGQRGRLCHARQQGRCADEPPRQPERRFGGRQHDHSAAIGGDPGGGPTARCADRQQSQS